MTNPYRALCAELAEELVNEYGYCTEWEEGLPLCGSMCSELLTRARALLAQPEPEAPAEALAARPLLEQVAAMADCIGAHTVGQITTISDRAAAWLRENPPGQPVAIEPRGCPMPGACSCVEPAAAVGAVPEPAILAELLEWLGNPMLVSYSLAASDSASRRLIRAAELLARPTPQPVAVSERLPGPEDCDEQGRCWMFGNVEGDWRLISTINPGIPKLKYCFSHWLPANALPTPEALDD